ncbi:two-component system response regulator NarL, partial [Parasutterella sp. NM82_D38]|nr:two-component system response regulator NarL [Parasutterella muris]
MAETYRVVVVDDHPLFRRGVVQLLGMNPIFEVVAEAGDFESAM